MHTIKKGVTMQDVISWIDREVERVDCEIKQPIKPNRAACAAAHGNAVLS